MPGFFCPFCKTVMSTIEDQLASLNPDQRSVALELGHCLAIAAPGSGKTKTLAVKAAYLLDKGHTVTAVTFTRDSALELRDRIASMVAPELQKNLLVGTFHSIDRLMAFPKMRRSGMGENIISKGHSSLTRQWVIVKDSQRRSFIDRAINECGLDMEVEEASSTIEAQKSGYLQPETEAHVALQKTYQDLLARHGVIDFQDILLETNRGIERKQISTLQTDHLMIDEFQDTDSTQFKWIMLHAYAGVKLTAVGDDDQSIYGFRRALGYKGMMEFQDRLQATQIILGMNYRSHQEVLSPSSRVIDHNESRMEKDLISFKGEGGSAFWEKFDTRLVEAKAIERWAKKALDKGETVGILARTNARLNIVESEFKRTETPYVRGDGTSIIHTKEMNVLLAMLGMLVRKSRMDMDQVMGWCQISEEEISGIHKTVSDDDIFAFDKATLAKLVLCEKSRDTYADIVKYRDYWAGQVMDGGNDMPLGGVVKFLQGFVGKNKRSQTMLEIVAGVFAKHFDLKNSDSQELADRIKAIEDAQRGVNENERKDGDAPVVSAVLTTAHSSKGLEYDNVWILGAEKGAFPDEKASMQEERRLFFVAMTRARKNLVVSASGAKPISNFVEEAQLLRIDPKLYNFD